MFTFKRPGARRRKPEPDQQLSPRQREKDPLPPPLAGLTGLELMALLMSR